jgi:hypothetical protein
MNSSVANLMGCADLAGYSLLHREPLEGAGRKNIFKKLHVYNESASVFLLFGPLWIRNIGGSLYG